MSLSVREISLDEFMNDYETLFVDYVSEVEDHPEEVAINWPQVHEMWNAGTICIHGMVNNEGREDEEFAGFVVDVIYPAFHKANQLTSQTCSIFVAKKYRGNGAVGKLLDVSEEALRGVDVVDRQVILPASVEENDFHGHRLTDMVYTKRIS